MRTTYRTSPENRRAAELSDLVERLWSFAQFVTVVTVYCCALFIVWQFVQRAPVEAVRPAETLVGTQAAVAVAIVVGAILFWTWVDFVRPIRRLKSLVATPDQARDVAVRIGVAAIRHTDVLWPPLFILAVAPILVPSISGTTLCVAAAVAIVFGKDWIKARHKRWYVRELRDELHAMASVAS